MVVVFENSIAFSTLKYWNKYIFGATGGGGGRSKALKWPIWQKLVGQLSSGRIHTPHKKYETPTFATEGINHGWVEGMDEVANLANLALQASLH